MLSRAASASEPRPAPPPAQDPCGKVPCRAATTLELRLQDGRTVSLKFSRRPWILGVAVLLPGESVVLTGDVEGDRLVKLRRGCAMEQVIKPGAGPANLLTFRFEQGGPLNPEPHHSTLTVSSTFPGT
jgi:hypothetical protein